MRQYFSKLIALLTAPYLMELTCYLHEKHKNIRTVAVHSVTFYVHVIAIVNNGVDIFMGSCNYLHALAHCC